MKAFLSEFRNDPDKPRNVIFVEQDGLDAPRQYAIIPRELWKLLGMLVGGAVTVTALLIVFTPVRQLIPGYGTESIRQNARLNAIRLEMLEDSLQVQGDYIARLRFLITGEIEDSAFAMASFADPDMDEDVPSLRPVRSTSPPIEDRSLTQVVVNASLDDSPDELFSNAVTFPSLPPVDGFLTRGFDAASSHFGTDVAVPEGTPVRAIADGYVVFSDWTQEGGHAVGVQHAAGYISIYKHNLRLTKRVGERVRDREIIAVSGNSGEVTTGPHLHFELWRNGLAQDPRYYVVSW
ncbi:MAG: M23 family metallopeptidase [Rhodothermales bacterium]|nr:M23 family metallopeptidase [Rhodothermales bacterium]